MRRLAPALLLALLAIFTTAVASPPLLIETVVGGNPGNQPALAANIFDPIAVAVESDGDLLIASRGHDRIYRVDSQGMLSVFAGTSHRGFGGDGGPAVDAHFNGIWDITLDAAGNLYVVDGGRYYIPSGDPQPYASWEGNRRVRRIDAVTGIITTVAGGAGGPTPATQHRFGLPVAAALDGLGNLYVLDTNLGFFNGAAYRVVLATGAITPVALGVSMGDEPFDLTVDASDNLFIADTSGGRVLRVDGVTGAVTTVAGGGTQTGDGIPATAAQIRPARVTIDPDGNLLIENRFTGIVRKVDLTSGIITTPGLGVSGRMAFDMAGNIYAPANPHLVVRRDASTGQITTVAGNGVGGAGGDGGLAIAGSLSQPNDVVFDADGHMIIGDSYNLRLRRVERGTGILSTLPVTGGFLYGGDLTGWGDIAINLSGDLFFTDGDLDGDQNGVVWIRIATTGHVEVYAGGGGDSDDGIPATQASLHVPTGVAVDSAGNLHIASYYFAKVRKVDAATRIITTVAGIGQSGSSGDGDPATDAQIGHPYRIAFDAADNLYIFDDFNRRIRRVEKATGIITTAAGNGDSIISGDGGPATAAGIGFRAEIATDKNGDLLILAGGRVRRVDSRTGIIETIAGTGIVGYSGDGGAPLDAAITGHGMALSPFGSIHLAATESNRIRRLLDCVADVAPPSLTLGLNTRRLLPANHKMIPILVTPTGSDDCGAPLVRLVSITSNEPDDAPGNADGNTTGDIQEADFGAADFEFLLRAERSKDGMGRTYTVTYEALDESGKAAAATARVFVPVQRRALLPPQEP